MKKVLTVLSFLILLNQADSQVTEEWEKRYNGPGNLGDGAGSIKVDGAGNVYVTGYSEGSETGDDYSTTKYGPSGGQLWTSRYNGPGNSTDRASGIAVDGSGNVYVTGISRSGIATNTEDYATVKYSSNGIQQWEARYNGTNNSNDGAYAIGVDNSGNVYVTGSSFGSGGTDKDYVTIKYNSSGAEQWVQRYNGLGNSTDEAYRIAVSDLGNVYVTGYSIGSALNADYLTIKYSSSGDSLWVRNANWGAHDVATSISVDGLGNVYVTGLSYRFSAYAYLTIKYNSSGVEKWVQIYDGFGSDIAYSIGVDGSGNVYVTGYSKTGGDGFDRDYLTIKYDSSGAENWQRRYNGPGNSDDTAYSLALDDSGNVYVTGSSVGSGTGNDYATIKYNPSGVQQWVQRYDGPVSGSDLGRSIAVDEWGYVYVTGVSEGSGTGNDYATIKYSQTGFQFTLNLTAFIEGFYDSGTNNLIRDTVTVYLRNSSFPYDIIDSSKRKLSSSGTAPFLFSNAVNGISYYLEVKHRSSIATWSSSALSFTSGYLNYNFAVVPTQAYGSNEVLVDTSPLRYAIYSGDVNQDGFVNLSDIISTSNNSSNFISGYVSTDLNGDNNTNLSDILIAYNNSNRFVSVMRP